MQSSPLLKKSVFFPLKTTSENVSENFAHSLFDETEGMTEFTKVLRPRIDFVTNFPYEDMIDFFPLKNDFASKTTPKKVFWHVRKIAFL